MQTSSAMQTIGTSTAGWSKVGLGMARSLRSELDEELGEISDKLTEAINQTMAVQKYMDIVVSLVGNSTEDASNQVALLQGPFSGTKAPVATLPDTILNGVNQTMNNVMGKLTEELDKFLVKIKPALVKAGEMIIKFGDKIIQILESFSLTLDKVQKMFDQIMAQLSPGPKPGVKELMMHDTYTLFDVSHTGLVSEADLTEVAKIYSISALQGTKPKELMTTYDVDGDGNLNPQEFALFVDDVSIPKSMAVVLRAYAKRLTAVAGNVGAARKRDEVALAVTKYFQLVCAKNRTKLYWVSDALGNGSLPLPFTADIFKNLAQQVDNPDVLTTADVGQVVITAMMELHPVQVMAAVDLMTTPEFWTSEGFDPKDHPLVMSRVTTWVAAAQSGWGASQSLLEEDAEYMSAEDLDAMSGMAALLAEENMARHEKAQNAACSANRAALFSTESSQYMLHHLLGGVAASDGQDGAADAAKRAVDGGVAAKPETLQFAKFLSWNASATASRFQDQSFEYTSESSSALDSFANQIQGMVKKITGFINMVEKHATPAGIEQLETDIHGFAEKAEADIITIVNKKLGKVVREGAPKLQGAMDGAINKVGDEVGAMVGDKLGAPLIDALKVPIEEVVGKALNNTEAGVVIGDLLGDAVASKLQNVTAKVLGNKLSDILNNSINDAIANAADLIGNTADKANAKLGLVQTGAGMESFAEIHDMQMGLTGGFDKMATLMRTFLKLLPQATDNLKFAKQEVGEAAKVMDTVFEKFEMKGPAIFDNIAKLWTMLWSLYFVFLLPMTLGLLYYGFWASGYFGGPQALSAEPVVEPQGFTDRLCTCCSACNFCMKSFHDTQLCFWSCIILFEAVCLLIFVISLVLCCFAGVKAFMSAGCAQVYLLNDNNICLETVGTLRKFLATFYVGGAWEALDKVCFSNNLLTCNLIASEMASSCILTTVFSFLAAVFSFQMIIESACLHTRARYRRMIDGIGKEEEVVA
jgi:hypothetical protein